MACANVPTCPLYPKFTLNALLRVWQISYCESNFERCERLQLSRQGKPVPPTLLPNGKHLDVT